MRRILSVSILVLGCLAAFAGTPSVRKADDSKYVVSVGSTTLVVDAAQGGKVLSYKYKDSEIISQVPRPNAFGSTFWTSPQIEWNWPPVPEYDTAPYEAEIRDGALFLTGPVCDKFKYRILKEYRPDPADDAVVVTYTIVNESNATRSVAPWEITRVLNGGLIFFDAPLESVEAANGMGAIDFKEVPGLDYVWFTTAMSTARSTPTARAGLRSPTTGSCSSRSSPTSAAAQDPLPARPRSRSMST